MKILRNLLATLAISFAAVAGHAQQGATPDAPFTLFTNVHIFDGINEERIENASVLVEGNIIKEISSDAIDAPDAVVIDGDGRTLMPGLVENHVHFNLVNTMTTLNDGQSARWDEIGLMITANARDFLMDGYTTVRDACGSSDAVRHAIDRGDIIGPRFYASGACISPTSGHGDWRAPSGRYLGAPETSLEKKGVITLANNPDEVREAVRENLSNGATQIKLFAGGGVSSVLDPLWSHAYTQEELEAAVEAAEFFDTYVTVHAYTDRSINAALDAGVKGIEHGQMAQEETVKRMAEMGTYWALNTAGLTPDLLKVPNYASGPVREKVEYFFQESKNLVEYVKKYKPKIVHNVDSVLLSKQAARAHRDFEKYYFASLFGNHAMLVSATSTAGELAQITNRRNPYPGKFGVIEEGAYADILIVDGNPLEDITVIGGNEKWFDAEPRGEGIETIRVIMKDGIIYKNTLEN
ncbi:putative chlorohydrolase/aminohydrolase [Ruegeria denitrificans]|uniref:Putative chlorohydrolase/aminohydrolase n=1 Tax=Ruegeria denitrificans TaxID=1715692 RepID=A0A0P1IS97_9RHOB|nr:amidohydrolase family protein [Ruegeria denitrificans]CUK17385.1 putative chlorohydrolase/aminohydrolase [Ruegeria denitrificans]